MVEDEKISGKVIVLISLLNVCLWTETKRLKATALTDICSSPFSSSGERLNYMRFLHHSKPEVQCPADVILFSVHCRDYSPLIPRRINKEQRRSAECLAPWLFSISSSPCSTRGNKPSRKKGRGRVC